MKSTPVGVTSQVLRAVMVVLACSVGAVLHADDSERRLLLPLNVVTAGAYGAVFSTHLTALNRGDAPIELRGIDRFCAIATCDHPAVPVAVLYPGFATGEFEDRGTPGRFIFYPASAQLDFNLRARDSSRDQFSYGTEVPVVEAEAFRSQPFNLLAVQSTEPFRAMLRVYGVTSSTVTVRALRQADNLVLDEWSLLLSNPENEFQPAYAELPLPGWGISFVRIQVIPQSEQFPVWAFASVTNNITQQFTLVTPR